MTRLECVAPIARDRDQVVLPRTSEIARLGSVPASPTVSPVTVWNGLASCSRPEHSDGDMNDRDWDILLARIRTGRCTPFLGAGACAGSLPLGGEIAEKWANEHEYPLEDRGDLSRVAQFVGIANGDPMWPKDKIRDELHGHAAPDFSRHDEPHGVLAELPLPVYLTTNYDDFMTQALAERQRSPLREFCRWNASPAMTSVVSVFAADPALVPSVTSPIVFHLHGHFAIPESIVLTEDDYLDFLVAVSRKPDLIPHQIQKALAASSLLFVGYRLADWSFRVIHRGLVSAGEQSLRRLSVTVQLRPSEAAEKYLDQYFGAMNVRVYWGTATEFAAELRERWEDFTADG
jgi:hypothetical protein